MLKNESDYIHYITKQTKTHNMDNISRTKAYQTFYFSHPEIQWSLLASIVSRNAGWNMTDLSLSAFLNMLGEGEIRNLLMTYERANWLIFSDAYPQLLIYDLSITMNQSYFHLLPHFNVSHFIIREWEHYWQESDYKRLMRAQIINEQNLIQTPVIAKPFIKRRVFHDVPYILQNMLQMNAVLFPVRSNQLYGLGVKKFTNLTSRIELGKQLSSFLFTPSILSKSIDFITHIEHTGTRRDYEQYYNTGLPSARPLRSLYPVMSHTDKTRSDWYMERKFHVNWMSDRVVLPHKDVSKRYYQKRHVLFAYGHVKRVFKP